MALYIDGNDEPLAMGEEIPVRYPEGLEIFIDAAPFVTTGQALEEHLPGQYTPRVWVAVSPVCSNGSRLRSRLIAESKSLRARAERARLEQRVE